MSTETIRIPHRFRGPADSGNGGYCAGVFAQAFGEPACVRLKAPPPLDAPLTIDVHDDRATVVHGDVEIAQVRSARPDIDVPRPPGLDEAADCATRFAARDHHALTECFVCGTSRGTDGLELFTGPNRANTLVAAPWRPASEFADKEGRVRREILWAALDCPGYFGMGDGLVMALLGEITAEIINAPKVEQDVIVVGWPIGRDGRKRFAGSALFDASGALLAKAQATWIILKA